MAMHVYFFLWYFSEDLEVACVIHKIDVLFFSVNVNAFKKFTKVPKYI